MNQNRMASIYFLTISTQLFASNYDYTTSVRVNDIELNQLVAAKDIAKIITAKPLAFKKVYSECTNNYEYTNTYNQAKVLTYEIYSEDNPKIQFDRFYKTKSNYTQLENTQGRVWLDWNNIKAINEKIQINTIFLKPEYTLSQFKKDFPISGKNKDYRVLILETNQLKKFLKNASEFEPPYTPSIQFEFKNGLLLSLRINQAISC